MCTLKEKKQYIEEWKCDAVFILIWLSYIIYLYIYTHIIHKDWNIITPVTRRVKDTFYKFGVFVGSRLCLYTRYS